MTTAPSPTILARTLHRWSVALCFLGGCIGIPASVVCAVALYGMLSPVSGPLPPSGVLLHGFLLLGGSMLLGALLCLGGHLVAASAIRLQATLTPAHE